MLAGALVSCSCMSTSKPARARISLCTVLIYLFAGGLLHHTPSVQITCSDPRKCAALQRSPQIDRFFTAVRV